MVSERRGEHCVQSLYWLPTTEQAGRLYHDRFGQYRRRCRVCRHLQSGRGCLLRAGRARRSPDADTFDTDTLPDSDGDSYGHSHSSTFADSYSYRYGYIWAIGDRYRHSYRHTGSQRNTYINANSFARGATR